jgi:RNA methyltransferase, TrmH family
MFPVSKLGELSPRTRARKVARILQAMEVDAAAGHAYDTAYLRALADLLSRDAERPDADPNVRVAVAALSAALDDRRPEEASPRAILRATNGLRHALLAAAGAEPAEWDLVSPETGLLDRAGVRVLPMDVYLDDLRSPFNVGSIFRTAEAMGARRVLLSPRTPLPTLPRAERTALGSTRVLPWEVTGLDALTDRAGVFALETGGIPLAEFPFPAEGVVILGSEELGVSPEGLAAAERGLGRVSIPLAGAKRSLNVSVAFGILMQAWAAALRARS